MEKQIKKVKSLVNDVTDVRNQQYPAQDGCPGCALAFIVLLPRFWVLSVYLSVCLSLSLPSSLPPSLPPSPSLLSQSAHPPSLSTLTPFSLPLLTPSLPFFLW